MTGPSRRIAYFPGCAMKDQAHRYETGALAALAALDVEAAELPRWNCCGTVYALAQDDLMHHVGPVRNLVRAQEMGEARLMAMCTMCFGTLARSSRFVGEGDHLARINAFMDDEADYAGGVSVVHLLEVLRDDIGYDRLAERVARPLDGLRVAPYYGCMLLRPREIGVDDPDRPEVMERVVEALGAQAAPFAERTECCGAYLSVTRPDVVAGRAGRILASARSGGADVIVTTCPLCQANLVDYRPASAPDLPVVYLGELLAWALVRDAEAPDWLAGRLTTTGSGS
jgi:heterodisulfide reductase subunit B2